MLSKFFLNRPVFAWVIAIIIMVAGVWPSTICPSPSIRPSPRPPSPFTAFYPGPRRKPWKTALPRSSSRR
ncbi:MAG: hypothetical protein MZV70_66445 [Desulfobacterales bacterium]|nr:hypothetical protein [Desulfobacterales bacterium]